MQNETNNNQQESINNEKTANGLTISEITKVVKNQMHGYGETAGMSVMKLVKMLAGAVTAKKEEYDLSFVKDDDTWYIDLPDWPWKRDNLAMVCGADKMLDLLAASPQNDQGLNRVRVIVRPSDEPEDQETLQKLLQEDWVELKQIQSSLTGGATYGAKGKAMKDFTSKDYWTGEMKPRTLWLCPVTLFVFGSYPKYFYGKVISGKN